MLIFIEKKHKDEFRGLDVLLQAICLLAGDYCYRMFKRKLFVTSVFRQGDSGVHGAWRGLDADNDRLSHEEKGQLVNFINDNFQYDPDRPEKKVCVWHTADQSKYKNIKTGGDHFHFQVHPKTRRMT